MATYFAFLKASLSRSSQLLLLPSSENHIFMDLMMAMLLCRAPLGISIWRRASQRATNGWFHEEAELFLVHRLRRVSVACDNPQVEGITVVQFDKYLSIEPTRS
jgi:hypothetical protein